MKRKGSVLLNVIIIILILFLPIRGLANNMTTWLEPSSFENVSVHDPSIIKVDDNYYIFGSHLAAAKSNDLMNWELIASGVQDGNKLIPNVTDELKEALTWAESDTLWAPDVIQLSDGKFYFYYNACRGDSPLSAMGVAVADNIEGPYKDKGIFLKSGKGLSADETAPYDATKHPNVVDPHVFFDKEGKLWMVYGSYSGGIFIMELDPETGLPIEGREYENQGYGKRLMGLNHSRIEGPYIQYSPDTDYYYLFVSFGGLSADGGYNLRVARSKNPDGPYYDSEGQDMANAHGATGSFFDDRTIEQYGVKQIGNFKFSALGENTTSYGYVSPGHNSTYYDEETGKYFNIFHTRFPGKGEAHEVRVHQMLMNKNGWPVITPHRYTGETVSSVSQDDVVGAYHYINHGKEITDEIKSSVYAELESDGTISGAVTGTWELSDDYFIKLVIDETEDGELVKKVYDGVFLRQWDPTSQREVMTFSALSNEGVTVWGSQLPDMDDKGIADAVIDAISIPEIAIDDLELPTVGSLGLPIEWESSNPELISSTGELGTRPEVKTEVTLTATIRFKEQVRSRQFYVSVIGGEFNPDEDSHLIAYYNFEDNLEDVTGNFGSGTVTGDRINNVGGNITYTEGKKGKAAVFDGESGIRLPDDLIKDENYTISFWLHPEELNNCTTTFFGAHNETEWISFTPLGWDGENPILWSGSEPWYDAISNKKINTNGWTHVVFTVYNGSVNLYIDGDIAFKGSGFPARFAIKPGGIFALGVNWWDTPYKGLLDELRLYDRVLSTEEIRILRDDVDIPQEPIEDSEVIIIIAKIDALPPVDKLTLDDKIEVEKVRSLYELLTVEQKQLVKNLDKLIAAELKIAELEALELPKEPELPEEPIDTEWLVVDDILIKGTGHIQGLSIEKDNDGVYKDKIFTVGTIGESRRLEGFTLDIEGIGVPPNMMLVYRAHIQTYDDMPNKEYDKGYGIWKDDNGVWWKKQGFYLGTKQEKRSLEGIEIMLIDKKTDKAYEGYSIEYQVHMQKYGWGIDNKNNDLKDDGSINDSYDKWAKNGDFAGTKGEKRRIEAIRIRILKEEEKR